MAYSCGWWSDQNTTLAFDDVVAVVGPGWARVWRRYLAGGALAFEENRMGVDQIVAAA